jgi:uncharacterized protein YdeI (YjbR/CyaY-like superfamily)
MREADAIFFASATAFRAWLRVHHKKETELWVGFWRKHTGKPSLTWQESVDEALCYGWIDGIRKSRDAESYIQRFTPRKKRSNWSEINIGRVAALTAEGRMRPAGLAAFAAREAARSGVYSFEQRASVALTAAEMRRFRTQRGAWKFFESQPPGYRKTATWWVVSAKREATRAKRLAILIADSAAGLRIGMLRRN